MINYWTFETAPPIISPSRQQFHLPCREIDAHRSLLVGTAASWWRAFLRRSIAVMSPGMLYQTGCLHSTGALLYSEGLRT